MSDGGITGELRQDRESLRSCARARGTTVGSLQVTALVRALETCLSPSGAPDEPFESTLRRIQRGGAGARIARSGDTLTVRLRKAADRVDRREADRILAAMDAELRQVAAG